MKNKSSRTLFLVIGAVIGGILVLCFSVTLVGQLLGGGDDRDKANLEKGIVANIVGVNGAYVGSDSCSGTNCHNKLVNLYVSSTDTSAQAKIVADTLRYIWTHQKNEPSRISISVTAGTKPENAGRLAGNATNPTPIAKVIDPDRKEPYTNISVVRQLISFSKEYLAQQYGSFVPID